MMEIPQDVGKEVEEGAETQEGKAHITNSVAEGKEESVSAPEESGSSSSGLTGIERKPSRAALYASTEGGKMSECKICFEKPIESALLPCGHSLLCTDCALALTPPLCPVCRETVESVLRIFIS